jgi:hypothetical protein
MTHYLSLSIPLFRAVREKGAYAHPQEVERLRADSEQADADVQQLRRQVEDLQSELRRAEGAGTARG